MDDGLGQSRSTTSSRDRSASGRGRDGAATAAVAVVLVLLYLPLLVAGVVIAGVTGPEAIRVVRAGGSARVALDLGLAFVALLLAVAAAPGGAWAAVRAHRRGEPHHHWIALALLPVPVVLLAAFLTLRTVLG